MKKVVAQEMYIVVDEEGYETDTVIWNVEEDENGEIIPTPSNYVPPNDSKRLFRPKWNYDLQEWEEGMSPEEVAEKETEIDQEQNKPSDDEMNAIAIMELTELILGGGE